MNQPMISSHLTLNGASALGVMIYSGMIVGRFFRFLFPFVLYG